MNTEPTPLIIDTDVALGVWHDGRPRDIDDGFAIIEALNEPAIDLLGITTVYGNAPLSDTYRVAQELVALKQADIPVVPGASEPLVQNAALIQAAPPARTPAALTLNTCTAGALDGNGAIDFLAQSLRRQRLSIAAIGPLTNIALLALKHPELMSQIDQLVIVAGRSPERQFYIGDVGPVRDFNFENDVLAMQLLLDSQVPIVLAGFELTSQVCINADDLAQIKQQASATADYLYRNSLDWFEHWTRTFPSEAGFHPWDSATISWIREPDLFLKEARGCHIRKARLRQSPTPENPDDSAAEGYQLVCSNTGEERPVTYLPGFREGGKRRFVEEICRLIY